jgi:hypothetical protein
LALGAAAVATSLVTALAVAAAPGEASGSQAVTLSGQGKYVEFTLTEPANSIDLRYSVPDGNGGAGITAPLSLYLNGSKTGRLTLTSKYAWRYGGYPYANDPNQGKPHHLYDSARALFPGTLPAGAKVKLQVDAGDTAPSYTIDLADFELVAPAATRPANSVAVTDHGATPNDGTNDNAAFDDRHQAHHRGPGDRPRRGPLAQRGRR